MKKKQEQQKKSTKRKKKVEEPEKKVVISPNSIQNENLPDPNTWTPFTASNWKKDYRRALGDLSHHRTKFISSQALHNALTYTGSLRSAALYLNISPETLRKYARHYTEPESGKTYYELYKGKGRAKKGRYFGSRPRGNKKPEITKHLQDIVEGNIPVWGFQHNRIKNRLIETGLLENKCKVCGFHEKRLTDGKYPLILHHKNGVKEDFHLENIELLCYNCSFLYAESPITEKQVEELEDYTLAEEGDPITWELSDFHKKTLEQVGLLETGERRKIQYASEEFRRRAKILEKRKQYIEQKRKEQEKKSKQKNKQEKEPLDLELPRRVVIPSQLHIDWVRFEEEFLKEKK